jgi:quercetin dioxygenase-like cupin family protein
MHIATLEKVTKIRPNMEGAKGVYKQIPISKENGTPTFSFRVFTIEPGGHTPLHSHPFEHLNYIIEGNGAMVAEEREHELKKGDFVLVMT